MTRSSLPTALRFATLALLASLGACKPEADGKAVDRRTRMQASARRRGLAQRFEAQSRRAFAPAALSSTTGRKFKSDAPFADQAGWLVRGTDLLLFFPCANSDDYFIVTSPAVQARLKQFYRFSTQRPYIPVYVELSSRLVNDTLTVAETKFERIVEVKDFHPDSVGTPRCARPKIGRVLDHVRRYEPNL